MYCCFLLFFDDKFWERIFCVFIIYCAFYERHWTDALYNLRHISNRSQNLPDVLNGKVLKKMSNKCGRIDLLSMQGCRGHFTSSCLLIKFYGLISLCKVVVAFKTLNEKDKLNTLVLGGSTDNLYPSQVQF